MYKVVYSVILLLLMNQPPDLRAQDSTAKKAPNAGFRLGTYYTSILHYYGRTDSLRSNGFFPMGEFWIGKHFYLTAAPVFVISRSAGFDYAGTVTTTGMRFYKEKKYMANIYLVRPLYESNSQLVQSALQWQGAASYTWLNKWINVTAGADVKISGRTDFGATVAIDHIFRKEWKGPVIVVVDPAATVNAGSQQFTKTSYERNGFLIFPGTIQAVNSEVKAFNILSYELAVPVILIKKKWQFLMNPAFVSPQNLIRVEGRPDLSERGKDMFYVTTGLKYSF